MSFIDQPKIQFADNAVRDAFGNLRVSTPYTVFNSKQVADKQPLLWDEATTGGATITHQANQASTLMTVPATTVASAVRQSKRWTNYQSGKSQRVLATGVMGTGVSGITKRGGLFEASNGFFFEQSGSTIYVVIRSKTSGSVVDTKVAQSSWNIDKMDGTGASGITLDPTKTQIYVIDFQWLAVGRVRFGFNVGGTTYYCHEFNHANIATLPYCSNPNLPCRVEISNDGTGASASIREICWSVDSEGGFTEIGQNRVITRGTTAFTTNNNDSLYPLIAIRLKSDYNHALVDITKCSIICTSTSVYEYLLMVNPTVTGTAFSFTGLTNSAIEYDVTTTNATTLTTGDFNLDGGLDISGSSSLIPVSSYHIGSKIDLTSDIVVLAVRRLSGGSETFYASMVINEVV